jgi:LuxR family maltose regulon positive regulatory protein
MDSSSILQSKLQVPLLRSSLVPRPRLRDRLSAGLAGKLILVSAPAGYGKTTLVAEWLQGLETKATWLSFDEGDNDPRRFLMYLLAALRQIDAGIGQVVEAMMQSPQLPAGDVIMTTLLNEIAAIPQSFLLVFDDYHLLHAPLIFEEVNFLLDYQPQQMRMVVITREDPPLPLPRLRARGQMLEIRQQDLRFTLDECGAFLDQVMGLELPPADIAALERRTEGWIAGLQLAALSMRGRADLSGFVEAFTGSSHFVLDYLIEEVFNQQPADVQDFLLKTSVLERLCGSLCDAVTGRTDSRGRLERLEHANLFILPLDQDCEWYRYHHLFADLLHQRLQTSGNISETDLHRLASQWFQKEGFPAEAIQHSLTAQDWEKAAELISQQSVDMLRRGELITLLGWLKSTPENEIRSRPTLCLDYGWALALTGQYDAAARFLECAEYLLQKRNEQLGQVLIAQAYLARARREFVKAIELSERGLTLIAESDVVSRCMAEFTLGYLYYSTSDYAKAEPALMEACQAARSLGNDFIRQTALGMLGDIQRDRGRLYRAAELYRQALEEAHGSPTSARAQMYLADILYEWNDLKAAEDQIAQALKASRYMGNLETEANVYRVVCHLKLAQGDTAGAQKAMDQIHRIAQENSFDLIRYFAAACQTELAVAQRNIPLALQSMQLVDERLDLEPDVFNMPMVLLQAKLLLVRGQKREAGVLAAKLYERGEKAGWTAYRIETRLLQALATSSSAEALQFLREALKMAQPEGFIRTFVDRGEPMKLLLERLKTEGGELRDYVLTLLAAFGQKKAQDLKPQPLVEPMSERELEVLRLMADGLSNREIGEQLVITVGTTKSHVHHILEKLGTESRMQAAAKARELGLL